MSPSLQKLLGGVITLICAYFVLLGLKQEPIVVGGDAQQTADADLPGFDAHKMYLDLGGSPGEVPVVLFVTEWCPVCRALEGDLRSRGVKFLKADVEANRTAMLYYQAIVQSGRSVVPITLVGRKVFLGFKPSEIVQAIAELKLTGSAQAV